MKILCTLFIILVLAIPVFGQGVGPAPGVQLSDEGSNQGRIQILDCVGTGIVCAQSGVVGSVTIGARSAAINFSGGGTAVANGTTRYFAAGTVETGAATFPLRAPFTGNMTRMITQSSGVVSGTRTYTLYKNGAATAMTSVASGGSTQSSDVVNSVAVTTGDYLAVEVVIAGDAVSSTHNATIVFDRTEF